MGTTKSRAKKSTKGTVVVEDANGRLRLRWSYKSKRYCLAIGLPATSINLKAAKQTALTIELDITANNFDPSLKRYGKVDKRLVVTTLDLWHLWVKSLKLSNRTANSHYKRILTALTKANPSLTSSKWLSSVGWGDCIFNSYLGYLRSCFDWGIAEGYVTVNPYAEVKKRTVAKERVKPFTKSELTQILSAFRNNTYCSKKSRYPHSHYADFIEMLMLTGCRPSEIIGLQRKHIDFERGELTIESSLSRDDDGNSHRRVRKSTKTNNIRTISLTKRMRELLEKYRDLGAEDLLFTTHKGNPIDDRNFIRRIWKPILSALGIPYRRLYILRHTFASTALEMGLPTTSVAYLLGHTDTSMVCRVYGHLIDRPLTPSIL